MERLRTHHPYVHGHTPYCAAYENSPFRSRTRIHAASYGHRIGLSEIRKSASKLPSGPLWRIIMSLDSRTPNRDQEIFCVPHFQAAFCTPSLKLLGQPQCLLTEFGEYDNSSRWYWPLRRPSLHYPSAISELKSGTIPILVGLIGLGSRCMDSKMSAPRPIRSFGSK